MQDSYKKVIDSNFKRLALPPYTLDRVFMPSDYSWPGDHEGRALLAFCSHYAISSQKVPQFDDFWKELPKRINSDGYFGPISDGVVTKEQQLAGNSWFLRGLLLHHDLFHDEASLAMAKRVIDNLFLPALPHYKNYPTERSIVNCGGVYGEVSYHLKDWDISSDAGCLFISLDGIAHYYRATLDERLLKPLEEAVEAFMKIDKVSFQMQTHAALAATRGIYELYEATKEKKYYDDVVGLFSLYRKSGMTMDYENFNWFGREKTWTEPCCIVDSLIIAIELYRHTGDEAYCHLARRILFNGLSFCIRPNGGAGPNSCLTEDSPILYMVMDEAFQCCTMRLAEGLRVYHENLDMFDFDEEAPHKEDNRYFMGDKLLVLDLENTFAHQKHYEIDGRNLIVIPNLLGLDWDSAKKARLQAIFKN